MVENLHDSDKAKKLAEEIVGKVKDVVKKGNVTKILVIKDGETVVNFPLTVGVLGVVAAAPWALLLAAITTFGLDCSIDVVKEDGQIIHIV